MMTWDGAVAPALPPLTPLQRLRGALRLAALLALTVPVLALFLLGRFLRRRVLRGVKFHFLVARLWARAVLVLLGVRRDVVGAPMAAGGVWVSNHASWADIAALRSARLVNFVSKAEVRHWPGVGLLARAADTVFIERRRSQAQTQRNELAKRIRAGQLLCIFPEGTSSDGRRVLPFKSALFSALFEDGVIDAQVQPVTLNWIAPPGLPASFFGWWGSMPFEGHIWDVLCRSSGGAVEIVFHPPRRVTDFPDRKALTRWAEDAVRGGLRAGLQATSVSP
ncbi:MAG: 1-acyl-sn-glycerol-3-phosphate acyltransferase [Rhodobacterales bacterium CG_4_9_14_3_um_filter_71_31]|nr:MAG: 1-acyl-sn-glycerol-3-phosphate acyltransferase [Rhodobacterales bacterium CG_4_9_14_3_um_filter_71_31]